MSKSSVNFTEIQAICLAYSLRTGWCLHRDVGPKLLDGCDDGFKFLEVHGFVDVGVGVVGVGQLDVVFVSGGGKDDDRDGKERSIMLDFSEDVVPVFSGHIDVEENQVGQGFVGKFPDLAKPFHGFLPIFGSEDFGVPFGVGKCFFDDEPVGFIVFDYEDALWLLGIHGKGCKLGSLSVIRHFWGRVKWKVVPTLVRL